MEGALRLSGGEDGFFSVRDGVQKHKGGVVIRCVCVRQREGYNHTTPSNNSLLVSKCSSRH